MIAPALMDRSVADPPEVVKERALRGADDVALGESIDEVLLSLVAADEQTHLGSRALREHLPELPQFEQRDRRVPREVLFGLRAKRDEPRVVVREVREVGGGGALHDRLGTEPSIFAGSSDVWKLARSGSERVFSASR